MDKGLREQAKSAIEEFLKGNPGIPDEGALEEIWISGYHAGRHKEREDLKETGLLRVDTDHEIIDPCEGCEYKSSLRLIGCVADPRRCVKKQRYLHELEVLRHFGNETED